MTPRFDYFIVLADMRTGSNLLEQHLNALDGVTCHGEAFNPYFVGLPKLDDLLGFTAEQRDRNPKALLSAIRDAPDALNGFRFFSDHDQRILKPVLDDPRCAKIILTRNLLDSYLSLGIARETKQWKLVNIKQRRDAQIKFEPDEFHDFVAQRQGFLTRVQSRLQKSGQVPFHINYDDLNDVDILNGLAAWLGVEARFEVLDQKLRRQNPTAALSKVTNPADMENTVAAVDLFNLQRTPSFEPARGPGVSRYVAAANSGLMFLPIQGGPEEEIKAWLADLDGVPIDALLMDRNRKQVREWQQAHPGHLKFTVLRHPLARAHSVFCRRIIGTGPDAYTRIRNILRKRYNLPIPAKDDMGTYSLDQHHAAFSAFVSFLPSILAGQTPIRVDSAWCTQTQMLEGIASFALPDLILRESECQGALPELAKKMGRRAPAGPQPAIPDAPFTLDQIHTPELEALAADTYQRDYVQFGFSDWKPTLRDAT